MAPLLSGLSAGVPARGVLAMIVAWVLSDANLASAQDQKKAAEPAPPSAGSIPNKDLFVLVEFDGLNAHQAAWERTAACKILTQTKLGALLENQFTQYIDRVLEVGPGGRPFDGKFVFSFVKQLFKDGFAVGVWGKPPWRPHLVVILRKADRPEVRKSLIWMQTLAGNPPPAKVEEKPDERVVYDFGPGGSAGWWSENGDLIFAEKEQVQAISDVIDGKDPSALENPMRKALVAAKIDFEPVLRVYVNVKAIARATEDGDSVPVDRLEALWGFKDQTLATQMRVVAPPPRSSIMALVDQPAFTLKDLGRLPEAATNFTAISVDPNALFNVLAKLQREDKRPGAPSPEAFVDVINKQFKIDFKKDMLGALGTTLTVETQKTVGGGANLAGMVALRYSGLTVALEVRDHAALKKALEAAATVLIPVLEQALGAAPGSSRISIQKEPGDLPTYVAQIPAELLPPPLGDYFQPTLILGKERLVVGASKKAAATAAHAPAAWDAKAALGAQAAPLPEKMTYLAAGDIREITPILIAAIPPLVDALNGELKGLANRMGCQLKDPPIELNLQMIPTADELNEFLFPSTTSAVVDSQGILIEQREPVPTLASLLFTGPTIGVWMFDIWSARGAARRKQCVNNLKQIGLAMHNYHSVNNTFPGPIKDKDGKPLLSWRVAILPYIEQQELYNKFHLDEPWDSEHNKKLIKEMPKVYLCPDRTQPDENTTTYRIFVGKGALFDEDEGVMINAVTDGTSNTIMVFEASGAITWTKPEEIKFDPEAKKLQAVGSNHKGGFNVLFADGSVHFIKDSLNVIVFKALVTRDSGEVIPVDSY